MSRTYIGAGTVLAVAVAAIPNGVFQLADNNSHLVVPANTARLQCRIYNLDTAAQVNIGLGVAAVASEGGMINPMGDSWETPADTGGIIFTGAIYIISPTVSPVNLCFYEL
jgi:hypothetical protein